MTKVIRLVLMSGYPGSGKSTLAACLASRLDYPLVSKDAILVAIFEAQCLPADAIQKAGKAAWAGFWQMARSFPRAILDTNIKPRSRGAGTSTVNQAIQYVCERAAHERSPEPGLVVSGR